MNMNACAPEKVNAGHLRRNAYLYVRQSTMRQVFENTESTKRQYALRQRAIALGWAVEQIVVIDSDLGQSGASAVDREGFQRLVTEVSLGKAGIVLGLEVSRLARNSTDWHRLLEICALSDTLILDEDGIYDPAHFNDRLLLGLKGTMSEAELHVLKARLQGGILNKARRGELESPLPVGFVYNTSHQAVMDPDGQVQTSLRFFFETFRRTGSAMATVKAFRGQAVLFPRRLKKGLHKGDLLWAELTHSRALQVLHNPRYAGAFVYGRTRTRAQADGKDHLQQRPRGEWILLPDVHASYVSWQEYEENERRLLENAQAQGNERRKSPAREGPALLQGLVLCGNCGRRMTVRYHNHKTQLIPDYVCQRQAVEHGRPVCQSINGEEIDKSIGELLLETMTPMALEVALSVEQEIETRMEDVDRLRRKQVERARYEADLAERRYLQVDPANRLVADVLEGEWNAKLRALHDAQEEYERQGRNQPHAVTDAARARLATLAGDFPLVWLDPQTPDREKKRMIRLLVEDVTLVKQEKVTMHVRFKGGSTRSLELPLPLLAIDMRKTNEAVVREIDRLLDTHTEGEIALILNEKGLRSGTGNSFTQIIVQRVRRAYHLTSRFNRLRALGLLTLEEMAKRLGVTTSTVKYWKVRGHYRAYRFNDKGECLYAPPSKNLSGKWPHKQAYLKQPERSLSITPDEVQYEA
jgi:DNA invertase Pin-like site-specific DNA recombinase